MPTNSSTSPKNSGAKRNPFIEVSEAEKQLWAQIHSKGLLDKNVKDLYHKSCHLYETLFLSDNELQDLQHIEYLLWRLHYKHIDEFRRLISQNSVEDDKNSTNKKATKTTMEGFKLFLSEATKFYQELIRKIKRYYGLIEEPWFYKNDGVSGRIEQSKLHKCQFVSHRLCICLGDLARYLELYGKPENEHENWSVAASYYLEAAKIYPDSGNPHNQLAVLATYIGDEFLALYHCIRSLAVREPFPDAWQNLIVLFERNRSSKIDSMSNDVYDFSKPSEWTITSQSKLLANGSSSNNAIVDQSTTADLWSLVIRTTSFFFLESSWDSFPCTFTSTLRELETLLALDVAKLSSALESYKNFNLFKAGPYRALHIMSVLLFIIHNLLNEPESSLSKPENEAQKSILVKFALTTTFIFMGRVVDRCLKGGPIIYFPLLPALLVFVEWLVGSIDKVIFIDDEKCENAMCYFFASLVQLLNYLQEVITKNQVKFPDHIALWEDYELRGFIPLSHTHSSLDFSSHWEEEINYKMKNEYRAYRIIQAAMKIATKSIGNTRKWLSFSKDEKKFSIDKRQESEEKKLSLNEKAIDPQQKVHVKSNFVEEEEDIVFKPITRRNSEPIHLKGQAVTLSSSSSTSDEHLRRASSALVAQNRALLNSLNSPSSTSPTSPSKHGGGASSEGPIAAGPPSLSSWVINGDGLSSEKPSNIELNRRVLKPIDEMSSSEFGSLSMTKDKKSGISSPYSAAIPSAPLLPENSVWFTQTSPGFSPQNTVATQEQTSSISYASNPPGVFHPHSNTSNLIDHYPTYHLPPPNSHPWNRPQYQPVEFNGVLGSEPSRFNLLDGWRYSPTVFPNTGPPLLRPGSPLLRGLYDQRSDILFPGYQTPGPYISQAMTGGTIRPETEPQPLLHYLKQREWQYQLGPQFTGSPYMQN